MSDKCEKCDGTGIFIILKSYNGVSDLPLGMKCPECKLNKEIAERDK